MNAYVSDSHSKSVSKENLWTESWINILNSVQKLVCLGNGRWSAEEIKWRWILRWTQRWGTEYWCHWSGRWKWENLALESRAEVTKFKKIYGMEEMNSYLIVRMWKNSNGVELNFLYLSGLWIWYGF